MVPHGRPLAVCVPRTDAQRTTAVDCEDSLGRRNHSDQMPSAADAYATTTWPHTRRKTRRNTSPLQLHSNNMAPSINIELATHATET